MVGEIEAGTAFGVAGSVEYGGVDAGNVKGELVSEVGVGWRDLRGGDAEPSCLYVHELDQREIELVIEDGCPGDAFELLGAGDVIDVGVGDDDLFDGEVMAGKDGEDAGDIVAWVYDDGLAGGLVAEDGAVALERSDGEGFKDHVTILERSGTVG